MSFAGLAVWLAAQVSHIVFLNFADGSTRVSGRAAADDARVNASSLEEVDGFAPTFSWRGLGTSREQAIARVTAALAVIYAPFDVQFTTERPRGGHYTMALIGGRGSDLGYSDGMTGLGRVDCDNRATDEVVFVFPGEVDRTPAQAATIIAHELGHSFGLAHEVAPADIMFPAVGSPGQTFGDADSPLLRPGTCGRSIQNSFQILAATLGKKDPCAMRPAAGPRCRGCHRSPRRRSRHAGGAGGGGTSDGVAAAAATGRWRRVGNSRRKMVPRSTSEVKVTRPAC
jgi:hypothetical protein